MPLCDTSHGRPYVEPADLQQRLGEVVKVIESLLALEIDPSIKKRMLVHAIWEVALASGNYKPRYRSAGVVNGAGVAIQRDHVFQKKALVHRLLHNPSEVEQVVRSAVSCVVTKAEHDVLTEYSRAHPDIDGWARYQNAGITVHDMLTGTELTHDGPSAAERGVRRPPAGGV